MANSIGFPHNTAVNFGADIPSWVKEKGPLRIECDEMWSFVGHKGNKVWIWLTIDRTRDSRGIYR